MQEGEGCSHYQVPPCSLATQRGQHSTPGSCSRMVRFALCYGNNTFCVSVCCHGQATIQFWGELDVQCMNYRTSVIRPSLPHLFSPSLLHILISYHPHAFTPSFTRSLLRPFIPLLLHSFAPLFPYSFTPSHTTPSLLHILTYHSFTSSLLHPSLPHSFTP